MASSVGEAVSQGLERGLRIGTGLRDRELALKRQEEQDALAREDREMRLEDRRRGLERQQRADRTKALHEQFAAVGKQLAGLRPEDHGTEAARRLTERSEMIRGELDRELTAAGGADFESWERQARDDIAALDAGRGRDLPPQRLVMAVAGAARRPASDFLRVGGKPSAVGAGIADFREGLAGGDRPRLLRGANVVMAPDLARGVGGPSPHGGTIVGKEVVAFDQVPDSDPEDPQLVPRLRVWVKQDPKNDEEARLIAKWQAMNPDAPKGATGFYMAPVTEDRSADDNARVKVIGTRAGMQYLDSLARMEEWANQPEVAAAIAQGGGPLEQRYLAARAAHNLAPILSTKYHSIPAGGALLAETTDQSGRPVKREVIHGPARASADPELLRLRVRAQEALVKLRERSAAHGSDEWRRSVAQARLTLSSLLGKRAALGSGRAGAERQLLAMPSKERERELQAQIDDSLKEEAAVISQIDALERAIADSGGAASAGGLKPAPGANPNRSRMDINGNLVQ